MKRLLTILLASIISISGCASDVADEVNEPVKVEEAEEETATEDKNVSLHKVIRVVDGDTLIINYEGEEERLRLIGMDTPESVHPNSSKNVPEGKVASDYVRDMIEGKEVEVEFDVQERDQYGRLLAYVYLDDVMINKHLLEEGYAQLSTYPPNTKYVDEFTEIQTKARESNKGFWSGEDFTVSEKEVPEEVDQEDGQYVGSGNSDKYHLSSCRWAKEISPGNEVWFESKDDASNKGYVPCKVCKP